MKDNVYTASTFASVGTDIAISNGRFKIARGKDCYLVQIHSAIKTLLGELPLNPDEGIPYFGTIFGPSPAWGRAEWEERIRARIMKFDFVTGIERFETSVKGANLNFNIIVNTDEGIVDASAVSNIIDQPIQIDGKPLKGQVIPLENVIDVYNAQKKIIEALGGTVV